MQRVIYYVAFLIVPLLPGYIHPDEYHQNLEITSSQFRSTAVIKGFRR
jgi:hypothetical protein